MTNQTIQELLDEIGDLLHEINENIKNLVQDQTIKIKLNSIEEILIDNFR